MTDPVLAIILIVSFFAALAAASFFKTLETSLVRDARIPIVAGLVCGVLMKLTPYAPCAVAGILLTIAALYVRLTGHESEPTDGMTLGAITGAAAAVPALFFGDGDELLHFAKCVLAGAVAGYGITFGLAHVRAKLRQAIVDAITAGLAVFAAWLPALLLRARIPERQIAVAAAAIVPLILIVTVFKQWPAVRGELRHEAALGVIDDEDVRITAHPILRLGRGGWHDASAHREFVRLANTIALRKRQQRGRSEEVARLYQLEVLKLRRQLQDMTRIDRMMRAQSEREQTAG
jgi:hypothetical protein